MKGKILAITCFSALMTNVGQAAAVTGSNQPAQQPLEKIAPYPAAEKGMTRQVIWLPAQTNEDSYKLELLIGKEMETDCNRRALGAKLEKKTLKGWGYDYLVVDNVSGPVTTMMACPDKSKKVRFVQANLGENALQRYNSRLPVVVYAPQGVEVRYRLWKAEDSVQKAALD
jgi:ecotin